jgi:hypothetical protein
MELTPLQERVLQSAASGAGGRLIFWVLGDGRHIVPGISDDIAGTLRALEGAGFLTSLDAEGRPGRPTDKRSTGSHVAVLTDAGRSLVRSIAGR